MVTQTIPASKIVNVTPGVVAGAGSALDFIGVVLTNSTRVPIGTLYSFADPDSVSSFFGATSAEYAAAKIYFTGPDDADVTPGALMFAQYPSAAVAGYVRGAPITLAQVQAIVSGTLSITPDGGAPKVSSALNLSTATSLSNAAATITAAFTTPGFVVTYDSQSGGFVVTSSTTGATSAIVINAGANATALALTAAAGAVTSPGAAAAVPGTFMDALVALSQDWLSFGYLFKPSISDRVAFAAWNNGKNNRYVHLCWDDDANNKAQTPTSTVMALVTAAGYSGTQVFYAPLNLQNAVMLAMSYFASLDFDKKDGRKAQAFRSQAGLPADVTDGASFDILKANGLNFIGAYSSANNARTFIYPGSITGKFLWADSYGNEVWLNDALQVALLDTLTAIGQIPFNDSGDAIIEAGCADPINAALNYGAIRTGVELSAAQKLQVNTRAGIDIANTIETQGYYLQPNVSTASAAVRQARGPVQPIFWYADGQSVQSINLTSLEVQ